MEAGARLGAVRAAPGGATGGEPVGVPPPPRAKLTGLAALDTVAAQAQLRVTEVTDVGESDGDEAAQGKRGSVVEVPYLTTMWPPPRTPERAAFVRRTAASWALLGAMMGLYIMVFTSMGAGPRVYLYLLPATPYSLVCYLAGGLIMCVAYCTDIEAWPSRLDWLRLNVAANVFILFFLAVLLSQSLYPEAGHVFMAVTVPVAQCVLKRQLLPKAELLPFMRALAFGLAASGVIVLALFIPWMLKHAPAGMTAAVADLQAQLGSTSNTGPMFMWGGPCVAGLWCIILAALAYYVSTSSDPDGHSAGGHLVGFGLLFPLLCSWTAAQVGTVQMRVADALQILCGAGLASTGLITCIVLGWEGVVTHPKVTSALASRHGDWMRAILVSFLALPYVAFLPLSVLNQAARTRLWCASALPAGDLATWTTPLVSAQLRDMRAWNWSSVGPKAMRVALGFICIIVGLQKSLTLFFVWFIAAVSHTPPGATVAIFIGTGVGLLYIIPWMAAVPLYLTGGVVVTAALRDELGFWRAAVVAVAVCAFTKGLAVYALHQSLGTTWMKQAKIRKDFELRSIRMRAMEMIVFRGWLDRAKLYLLVAGPDWLTAVLAGMLGTNVWHILLSQTLPSVLLLSLPATLAGAFQLRLHDAGFYGPVSSALIFLAAATQGLGIVFFYSHINQVATEHEEYLRDKPNDREVEELEELFERTEWPILQAVEERIDWQGHQLPGSLRAVIAIGVATMGIACTLIRYASKSCFTRFQINDSVTCPSAADAANPRLLRTRNCLHGDGLLLVKHLGWIVLGLFAVGFACYRYFFNYCHRLKLHLKASGAVHPADALERGSAPSEGSPLAAQTTRSLRPRGKANPIMDNDIWGSAPEMTEKEVGGDPGAATMDLHLHHLHRLSDLSAATGSSIHM